MKNKFILIVLSILCSNFLSAQNSNETRIQINQINELMNKSNERDLFNGNVLVAKQGKVIYQKSFGFTDESQNAQLTKKSIFNFGSIAKEFNAVSIMMLVERGQLNLDDPISKYNLDLPKWSEKVTTRHLINYASGIPRIENKMIVPKNDEEAWEILRKTDTLLFEPGKGYRYDNGNVFLQRRIIEKITGMTFQDFVTKNILQPLKMNNSVFDAKSDYKNRTFCYDMDNVRCPEIEFISGWLWLDINDMYKWIDAMNQNRLISKKSYETLLINPYAKEEGGSLGMYTEKDELQRHNGISYKFESILLNDMKNDVIVILASNNLNKVYSLGYLINDIMKGKAYEIPKKSVSLALRKIAFVDGNKAIETYYTLKKNSENEYAFYNPSELNALGYELLRAGKINESIEIFKLVVKEFPQNPNVVDSLGEAYYTNKQYELALVCYKKAIELGGTGGNAEKMLKKIEEVIKQ